MNRDELSVYADQLQIEGDIRGEIIALELLERPELTPQREALMTKWLGPNARGWPGVRFRYGFVDCLSSELARVLATPAGPFVRSVSCAGNNTDILHALRLLAAAPRPWLARLSIVTGRRWGERRAPRASALVDDDLAGALVAATPALVFLDVTGSRVVDAFPHPTVERVRVIGYDAIAALAEAGPAMPAVRSLFYAFTNDPSGRVAFGEHGLPKTLLARSTLPRLTALDVSANRQQRSWEDQHVAIFELLSELGVLAQLTALRVPPVIDATERDALAQVQLVTPAAIDDTADRPSPLHDEMDASRALGIRIPGRTGDVRIWERRLGELMSAAWAGLDAEDRGAWLAVWRALREVPQDAEDYWNYDEVPGAPIARALLANPLATLGDRVDDDLAIASLAEALATSDAHEVSIRRYAY